MIKKLGMQKQSLESIMWNCRNKGSDEEALDTVMDLVFLKFAGDKFASRWMEIHQEYIGEPAIGQGIFSVLMNRGCNDD